ncbi:hypothetical protein, partial [Vibrio fluvialis]|uniref:hypothetical protein n=1 Tax=Vibrio fluvialis TaxID=676 RepID=UPI001F3EF3F1
GSNPYLSATFEKAAESSAAFFISALPFFSYQCTEHYRFQISATQSSYRWRTSLHNKKHSPRS